MSLPPAAGLIFEGVSRGCAQRLLSAPPLASASPSAHAEGEALASSQDVAIIDDSDMAEPNLRGLGRADLVRLAPWHRRLLEQSTIHFWIVAMVCP